MAYELQFPARIKKRIESGRIIEQKIWSFIRELNSFDEEHLDAPALIDGCREYTYRQMFRKWDEYAEVFSALNITGKNSSRAGLLPDYSSGAVFSLYALNMTGVSVSVIHYMDLLDTERWDRMIEKEGITDLVLCDRHLTPELLARVAGTKERCGLRNIIVLHDAGTNRFEPRGAGARSGARYGKLKQVKGVLFMKDLLRQYEAYPVVQARKTSRNDAVILHTSGTTNGIHKPVPLSDRGFNESAARLLRSESLQSFEKPVATVLLLDMTASFSILDMLHHPFAFGGSVLIVPDGGLNPKMPFYIAENKITVLFAGSAFLDILSRLRVRIDLSNLEQVYVGGTYTSADVKKRCNAYLKKNGSKARISIGYGATETGSSCILAPPDRDDDAIGYPLPGVRVKIFNEAEEKYYDLEDGPGTGVLLISSPSVSSGAFNGTTFFELEEIDGEKYYNTYDLVTVHEDGSMSCVGRMNKFFVNNEGVRFDAGLVETAVGAEPKIVRCALAPVYEKYMHDTVPVLYVQTSEKGLRETEAVRNALCNVFIRDNKIAETNLPGQCVITDQIPLNEAGKVDVTRILKGEGQGQKYSIRQVKRGGRVVGLRLKPAIEGINAFDNVPDELRYEGNLAK
ncbi:MAG: class I adenylate-forming enzyme family protein, partial [Eubacteriales bacterium]|nr:class I adenylate-forming enzyme family protein [Eubacteriales bacterium]